MRILVVTTAALLAAPASFAAADHCEFIREAIRAMPESGGRIDLPEGVFSCRSKVVIDKSNVELRGAGQDKTILKLADQSPSPLLVIGDDEVKLSEKGEWITATRVENVRVSDLTADGNLANQDHTKECGDHSCDGDPSSIRNNAITIRGANDITLENVTGRNAISGGLVTEKYCHRLHVRNFKAYGNHFDGFAGYQTEESLFENVDLSRNRAAGISIDIDFANNRFLNGTLHDNGDVAIFGRDIRGVVFEALDVRGSGNHGAYLGMVDHPGPDDCTSDNEFRDVSFIDNNGHGVHLATTCSGNKITGKSVFTGNKRGCYFVDPGGEMGVSGETVCQ